MSERKNQFGQCIGPAVAGWGERAPPPRTMLSGRYCRLEPVEARHAADLFAAYMDASDARDWTYLFSERPESEAACREYVHTLAASTDPLHFAVVDSVSNKALGSAALMRIDPVHGVIEVGAINYSPRLQKTRVGTEAMYLLMRLVFDELGYRRYEWKCDSLNSASRSAAKRYGFTFEGIFRCAVVYKGRSRDTAWFSVLAGEWPRLRQAFEIWLQPQNFDERGRQRQALANLTAFGACTPA